MTTDQNTNCGYLRKYALKTTVWMLTATGLMVTHVARAADVVPLSEPIVVLASAHGHQAGTQDPRRPQHRGARMRRDTPVVLPGVGPISPQLLKDLALDEAQTQHLTQARAAQRAWRRAQRSAMQDVHKLRAQQLSTNTLDPRALLQAQQAVHAQHQSQQQTVQNHWLALWDSLTAQQQDKVVQAVKRRDTRRDRATQQRPDRRQSRTQRG